MLRYAMSAATHRYFAPDMPPLPMLILMPLITPLR